MVHLRARLTQQLRGCQGCAAGCNKIIDQNHALALAHRRRVDFEPVFAIFKSVVDANCGHWQFAWLADGDEAQTQLRRNGCSKDKAARFHARYRLCTKARDVLGQMLNAGF